jgi:hypothetical protein
MRCCHTALKVDLMHFFSFFRLARSRAVQAEAPGRVVPSPAETKVTAAPPKEVPDDLDARVRLLGEWQVSEL